MTEAEVDLLQQALEHGLTVFLVVNKIDLVEGAVLSQPSPSFAPRRLSWPLAPQLASSPSPHWRASEPSRPQIPVGSPIAAWQPSRRRSSST